MSGPEELKTAKERLAEVDKVLDEYEGKSGLPPFKNPAELQEIHEYMDYSREQIEKLSAQECALIGYRIAQLSFHVQRSFNREVARVTWAKANLAKVIAAKCGSFDKYTKHEMKVASIIAEDAYAASLDNIMTYAQERADRLTFLANSLQNLSNVMLSNQRAKTKYRGSDE